MASLQRGWKPCRATLASYLSEFVAETLQASRTSQGAPLTDEENIHLLGANFTACVSDWIGGFCPADSLMIWFPAHWALQVIRELESREQDFRQRFPQWFDDQIPDKYRKQYQDARDSRTLPFQKRQYLKSPIQLLTASIRVDWFSLPNKRDLDTWYEAVFTLPIAWPDITDIDPHYLKKTSGHQLLSIRMQMGVSHMWGEISPQWHLLTHHLWNLGPGYHAGRLEELLILNRPCRPGEDVKDSVLPRSYWQAGGTGKVPRRSLKQWLPRQELSGSLMRTKWSNAY